MKNCHNCQHSDTLFSETNVNDGYSLLKKDASSVLGDHYGKCLKGHQKIYVNWWKENSNKKVKEITDSLDCHEDTPISKSLDNMMSLLDEMGKLIDKQKQNDRTNK